MIVLVIAVLAYWGFQEFFNERPEIKPEAVAYLETVGAVQDGGYTVAYPPSLPSGWIATSVRFTPGDRPVWGLGTLTDAGDYAGVEQEDADLDTLLDTYVDKAARQGDDVTITPSVTGASPEIATTWTTWSDTDGDHALATTMTIEDEQQTLLVYGSAPMADLKDLAASLVTTPLP
jgi:hypothetical protein